MLFYVFYKKTKNHAVAAQLINGVLILLTAILLGSLLSTVVCANDTTIIVDSIQQWTIPAGVTSLSIETRRALY